MKTILFGLALFMLSSLAGADCGSCGGDAKKAHKHKDGEYVCKGEDGKQHKVKKCKDKDKKSCCAEHAKKATEPAKDSAKPATEPAKPAKDSAKPATEPAKPVKEPAKPVKEPAKPAKK